VQAIYFAKARSPVVWTPHCEALSDDPDFAFKSPNAAPLTPWGWPQQRGPCRQHLDQDQTPLHYLGE